MGPYMRVRARFIDDAGRERLRTVTMCDVSVHPSSGRITGMECDREGSYRETRCDDGYARHMVVLDPADVVRSTDLVMNLHYGELEAAPTS